MGPLSHIELLFPRFFSSGETLVVDQSDTQSKIEIEGPGVNDHQAEIAIKGVKTSDHQTEIVIKGTGVNDHQILLDIYGTEEHLN